MKKILILYSEYGNAHLQVAKYLEEYLNEQYQDEVIVKVLDGFKYANKFWFNFYKKLYVYNFNIVTTQKRNKLYEKMDHGKILKNYDKFISSSFANQKMKKFINDFNPDVVVSTIHGESHMVGKFRKKGITNVKALTILTDFEEHSWWLRYSDYIDYFIVNTKEMALSMSKKGINKNKIKPLGTPIAEKFFNNFDIQTIKERYKLPLDKKIILIFGGGGQGFKESLPYYEEILKKRTDIVSLFISGKNKKLEEKARELSKKYNQNTRVFGFVNNVEELMAISDIIVTKPGGLTIVECLAVKKPTIYINSIGAQENANLKFVENKKIGFYCNDVGEFKDKIALFLNDDNLIKSYKNHMKKISKSSSIKEVCKLIME